MIANYADHSENERTFLAWVRTAIAIVGFGLATARLGNQTDALWSEMLMMAAGACVILLAFLRMRRLRSRIGSEKSYDDDAVPADTLLLLLVAALFGLLATFALHVG
jgi:putative membrane protein